MDGIEGALICELRLGLPENCKELKAQCGIAHRSKACVMLTRSFKGEKFTGLFGTE